MPHKSNHHDRLKESYKSEHEKRLHVIDLLNRAFDVLDCDHDKVLEEKELNCAVLDAALSEETAEMVAVLKSGFGEIKELHKDGWFARLLKGDGITLADVLVFEHLLSVESDQSLTTQEARLVELAVRVSERVAELGRKRVGLYADPGKPLAAIKPQAVRQGTVGDCFFLAALASVANSNPETIRRIIKDNGDGSYTVRFPGARDEPIEVKAPTIVELALYAQASRFGTWPAVLEKAYGVYLAGHVRKRSPVPAENTHAAEHTYEALDLLTGQTGHWEYLPTTSESALTRMLTGAFREGRAVAAATAPSNTGYTGDAGLPAQHAYSVIQWHPAAQLITLRNPWGEPAKEREPGHQEAVHVDKNGIFTMAVGQFRRNFTWIYYEDWTPDSLISDGQDVSPDAIIRSLDHS